MLSVLRNEEALRNMLQVESSALSAEISSVITNRQYWADLEQLTHVMRPFMAIIGTLESKSATLADCYHEVVSLAAVIDGISTNSPIFKDHCAAVFGNSVGQSSMMISTYWCISCTQACEEKALL